MMAAVAEEEDLDGLGIFFGAASNADEQPKKSHRNKKPEITQMITLTAGPAAVAMKLARGV